MQAFVTKRAKEYAPALSVKFVQGVQPRIKLYNDDKKLKETMRIDTWKMESIVEFLDDKLAKPKAAKGGKAEAAEGGMAEAAKGGKAEAAKSGKAGSKGSSKSKGATATA